MIYYINYFNDLFNSGSLFWFCALAGSGMFLVQFIINICGIGDYDSFDSGDISSDTIHDGAQDFVDAKKFRGLSLQTITGFLMMFGWSALTCQNEFGLPAHITIGISLTSGIITALLIRSVFKLAKKLMSTGTLFRIEDSIGKEGYIYQCIPKGGKGKISISLQNMTHEIDAISDHTDALPSFIRVKIIKKSDENTVVVAPL